jgi:DNA-binding NarL/FixJ family response regulator
MDIRMPGRDGVSATAAITADPALSGTRVIVLTTFDLDEYVHAALRAGASGFLLKDVQPTETTHVGHLLTKLNARDRTYLVIAAYEAGLINRT